LQARHFKNYGSRLIQMSHQFHAIESAPRSSQSHKGGMPCRLDRKKMMKSNPILKFLIFPVAISLCLVAAAFTQERSEPTQGVAFSKGLPSSPWFCGGTICAEPRKSEPEEPPAAASGGPNAEPSCLVCLFSNYKKNQKKRSPLHWLRAGAFNHQIARTWKIGKKVAKVDTARMDEPLENGLAFHKKVWNWNIIIENAGAIRGPPLCVC
jgi:hypothetical protein